jgi:hypothetical protein
MWEDGLVALTGHRWQAQFLDQSEAGVVPLDIGQEDAVDGAPQCPTRHPVEHLVIRGGHLEEERVACGVQHGLDAAQETGEEGVRLEHGRRALQEEPDSPGAA